MAIISRYERITCGRPTMACMGRVGRGEPVPSLRRWRVLRAMTQEELAVAAGLKRNTVSRLEARSDKAADLPTIRKLADALDCTPPDLMRQPE